MLKSRSIDEIVLDYDPDELTRWKSGDKSLAPAFVARPDIWLTQPKYHFGEAFVLRHYHRKEGWLGFADYAIGPQYPNSERRKEGRTELERRVPARSLAVLRALRAADPRHRLGSGEPDLFLYHPDGRLMFLEVKKQGDRTSAAQLECLGQISATIDCTVGVVYLNPIGRHRKPRSYQLPIP